MDRRGGPVNLVGRRGPSATCRLVTLPRLLATSSEYDEVRMISLSQSSHMAVHVIAHGQFVFARFGRPNDS